jgi:thiol-disulfide isomerase/thioredoxin
VRLWRDIEGIDAAVVSHRDEFEPTESLAAGKYTIFDFGADWCTPCRVAEKRLKNYLGEHQGVAVRAAAMEGVTPDETFALPVAQQHLKNAAGLPYFLLYSPDGKQLYRGQNLDKIFSLIEKKRN